MSERELPEPLLAEIRDYALDKGWSTAGAKWLAGGLQKHEALAVLAGGERRSPAEVHASILELAAQNEAGSGRKP